MYLMHEQFARARHQQDLAEAERRRLVRALTAHRRATRQHRRADRALAQARHRLAVASA